MSRIIEFKTGDLLIKSGSIEKLMYIILEGELSVKLTHHDNEIEVAKMKKGDFVGEISFFSDLPRSADVRASTNGRCVLLESLQQLTNFLMQNPKFATKMVQILAERLAKTDELLLGKIADEKRVQIVETKAPVLNSDFLKNGNV